MSSRSPSPYKRIKKSDKKHHGICYCGKVGTNKCKRVRCKYYVCDRHRDVHDNNHPMFKPKKSTKKSR
jgi:hypothetical protein